MPGPGRTFQSDPAAGGRDLGVIGDRPAVEIGFGFSEKINQGASVRIVVFYWYPGNA